MPFFNRLNRSEIVFGLISHPAQKNFVMKYTLKLRFFLVLLVSLSLNTYSQVSIIPKPQEMVLSSSKDSFVVVPQTVIVTGTDLLQPTADFLTTYIKELYGVSLKSSKKPVKGRNISLAVVAGSTPGSYTLDVKTDGIKITGADETGVFYGMQTLLQLLPPVRMGSPVLPLVSVKDAPRFQYRGVMLDVGRHFFSVSFVKKYIDFLALHKMNYLHWHLTEDQGWRIEIKKYPELTQIGGWRNGTIIGHHPGTGNDNTKYGGFYTQEEVKDIVQYAAKRYITVVPEIEMPGHASAAIAAMPSLSCFPNEPTDLGKHPSALSSKSQGKYVQETWGVHNDVFCAGNDKVFTVLQDVIDEVVALFPSKYFHIGGDECPKANWKRCPRCQARMKANNLKDEHELQSYFIQRIEKYINGKGRILIGWDEILEGGLAPNAMVMSWRGEAGGIEAAKQGHDVIMTPNSHMYIDHYQGKPSMEPLAIGGYLTLERVYSYDPIPAALTAEEAKYVKGVQANLWTEYVESSEKAEYMLMPRLSALSEVAWTASAQKNWDDFKQRMETQYRRFDAHNVNYARSIYNVRQSVVIDQTLSKATVSFATDAHASEIYYTIDGRDPGTASTLYTKPFEVRRTATIKAAVFANGKQMGKTTVQHLVIE
jgi:hexosaminidase